MILWKKWNILWKNHPQQEEEVLQRTFRSQNWLVFLVSINFPSPSLKELVVGFYFIFILKILKIPSYFGIESFRHIYIDALLFFKKK